MLRKGHNNNDDGDNAVFFIELCLVKCMLAYTKPQQMKKEKSESRLGERDQIKFIDLRFERWQVVEFSKARRRQEFLR